ncbi:MAG TPA: fatty acid desaturase [Chitinophagaceae bacterium]|nr:fatty acid desaturase [Chitinophagaceae bacterium]
MTNRSLLKKVKWKDLTRLNRRQIFIENNITLPWLFASWLLAYFHLYLFAIPCSFMFFLTALRQVHNGFHSSLGIGKKATWLTLYVNSILMITSVHAVKFSHLRHHKYCLGEQDHEGKCARLPWYKALVYGPVHIFSIHKVALLLGSKKYKWDTILELVSIALFISIVVLINVPFLLYHCLIMFTGEMFSAFFAVWSVHHDLGEHVIARTQRTPWKNFITYNMFYHLEHHLFPAVPTIRLPELARRIDEVLPELEKKETF